MSWFNVNIPDIVARAKVLLPPSCDVWSQRFCAVVSPDRFESQARQAETLLKSNTRQSSAPVTTNFKRVASPKDSVGHPVKTGGRPDPAPIADAHSKAHVKPVQSQERLIEPEEEETFFDAVEVQPHMNEPIWQAAKNNDHMAFVGELKKKPEVLNLRDESGKTPLDWMPESRRKTELYESVKHLLEQDVFVDAVVAQPQVVRESVAQRAMSEPIWQAARNGDHRAFFAEAQKNPKLLNLTDELGRKPLDLMPPSERKNRMAHSLLPVMKKYQVS